MSTNGATTGLSRGVSCEIDQSEHITRVMNAATSTLTPARVNAIADERRKKLIQSIKKNFLQRLKDELNRPSAERLTGLAIHSPDIEEEDTLFSRFMISSDPSHIHGCQARFQPTGAEFKSLNSSPSSLITLSLALKLFYHACKEVNALKQAKFKLIAETKEDIPLLEGIANKLRELPDFDYKIEFFVRTESGLQALSEDEIAQAIQATRISNLNNTTYFQGAVEQGNEQVKSLRENVSEPPRPG